MKAKRIRYLSLASALLLSVLTSVNAFIGRSQPVATLNGWLPTMQAGNMDDWHASKTISGMEAVVDGQAQTPDGPAKVQLSFTCTPGRGGTSGVSFVVLGATKLTGFDFDDFEGPDAPAAEKPLVTFTVHKAGGDVVVHTACSGSFTVSGGGFSFDTYNMTNTRGKVTELSDALIAGATSISVRVQGLKNPQKTIEATFQASGAAEALRQVMKACAKR
jgi:hypothetical protein